MLSIHTRHTTKNSSGKHKRRAKKSKQQRPTLTQFF